MAAVMAERGAGAEAWSVEAVAERAGVSVTAFEELFEDREECFLAAFDLAVERAEEEMAGAYLAETRWLDAVRAGLAHFLWFLESEPTLGHLLVVHSMGGGERVLRRRMEILATLAKTVDRGRDEVPAGAGQPPAVVAEGVVGAVLAVVQNRLLTEETAPPMELFGSLVSIVVLPYLGAGIARRELTRPAPRLRRQGEPQLGSAMAGGTRLTYRTARVLSAIHDYPGASNREVAEHAGIVDQGQVSKLLSRIEVRGLIEKAGEGRSRGAPNSWRLTLLGETLMQTDGVRAAVRSRKVSPA
jgi:AcrR family transcriptional regulator